LPSKLRFGPLIIEIIMTSSLLVINKDNKIDI
jgi:hypothetical protein